MPLLRDDLDRLPTISADLPTSGERLHFNEAAEEWPEPARRALLERLAELPFRFYPDAADALTAKLGERLGVPRGSVHLTPSGSAALDLIACAGLDRGDEVAAPELGFALVPQILARHRARLHPVPLGTGFPLDPWRAVGNVRQVWIPLPVNPTGAWISPKALAPILSEIAARPDPPLVVLDEAYVDFAPESHLSAAFEQPNVVVVRSFSKGLAAAGWRLGAILGRPELIARIARADLVFGIPSPALVALDVALDFADDLAAAARRTANRRDRVRAALLELGYAVPESAGNFLSVSPDPTPSLVGTGLLIRSLGATGAARITIGSEAAMARLASALGGRLAGE